MAETPPGTANLKLWMKLNDNAASSVVINEVGDNGVFYGSEGPSEKNTSLAHVASGNPPYLNGAFVFPLPEEDSWIVVPDSAAVSPTGDHSWVFWFYRKTSAPENFVTKFGNIVNDYSFGITGDTSHRFAYRISGDGIYANSEYTRSNVNSYTDDVWHLAVVTYDADGDANNGLIKWYINGVDETATTSGTLPNSIFDSTCDLGIAARVDNPSSGPFNGRFDNVILFNKVLTQDEINWLYNSGNGREGCVSRNAALKAQHLK